MVWPLPVCLAEHHQGKARRLRLVLATLSPLTKAEISSLQDGPYLPGGTTEHGLLYGYAVDAMPTPEWLVIRQSGRLRGGAEDRDHQRPYRSPPHLS